MAARKRRRAYTFMSEMPRSTQENNENQEVNTNVSIQTPTEHNQDTHIVPTQLGDSSQEPNCNNTIDGSVQSSLESRGPGKKIYDMFSLFSILRRVGHITYGPVGIVIGSSASNDVRRKCRG